jgi:curli production assembly/transport component CsgG
MEDSRLGAETSQHKELVSLPAPKEKIITAVYKFRDQTGQYKDTEVGSSWSTAVTQGSTAILIRTLEESKWFIPIEREGLSNLLNERKIIRSSRASFGLGQNEEGGDQLLPPLLYAGILIEGGIVSFDSNVLTGGSGARYFGAGASTEYREDRVTIYLRAVSTSNGRVLKTIYTSKTILSQKIDVGFFRFVNVKRLLEVETGFTYNEPGEMAVKEAIEKAVIGLVVEGLTDRLWVLKDSAELENPVIQTYLEEKNNNENVGVYNNVQRDRRSSLGIQLSGSALYLNGDYNYKQVLPAVDLGIDLAAESRWSGSLTFSYGQMGIFEENTTTFATSDASVRFRFFNRERFTPFIKLGAGTLYEVSNSLQSSSAFKSVFNYYGVAEMGFEYLITDKFGLNTGLNFKGFASDKLDKLEQGNFNDYLWQVKFGLGLYVGN